MFSSNQILQISGTFSQLQSALEFVLSHADKSRNHLCFQTTRNGKFCIGWRSTFDDKPEEGWHEFQYDFDSEIVAKVIVQFLKKQERKETIYDHFDGGTEQGFLMQNIPESFEDEDEENGIVNPFYGIVSFERFTNFYAK